MNLCFRLLVLSITISLSSCVAPLSSAERAQMRRVGVISLVGDRLRGSYTGLTAFGNEYYDEQVPDFAIDQILEQETANAMGPVAVTLPSERALLKSRCIDTFPLGNKSLCSPGNSPETIREIAARHKLDALAVWTPRSYSEHGMCAEGATLFSNIFLHKRLFIAPYVGLSYLKATGEPFRSPSAASAADPQSNRELVTKWKQRFADYTSEERAEIRSAMQEKIRSAAQRVPRNLGITN